MSRPKVKCIVWDLDNTIWDGVLSEDRQVALKPDIRIILKELDRRGILQSVSSKNDFQSAMDKLKEFKIDDYFLYPQINWNAKSENIQKIRDCLNFGIDTFAFVDDQMFEREEVSYSLPDVLCMDAADYREILHMEEMMPKFVTEDSVQRRLLYKRDIQRKEDEESYKGSPEDFLKTLQMEFTITRAAKEDLKRVEELTVRTHQLNSTGTVYSYEELADMIQKEEYEVLVAQLTDKYGDYGKIGLSVVSREKSEWNIKLLLMSCRVMSKGVGSVMLNYIMKAALSEGVALSADFIPTNHNRIMYITYKFAGFRENGKEEEVTKLLADFGKIGPYPNYVKVAGAGIWG